MTFCILKPIQALILLHSERPKLFGVLAVLSGIGLKLGSNAQVILLLHLYIRSEEKYHGA